MALPGWHPDPYGDYQLRYWDGQQWTDHVTSFGFRTVDPLVQPLLPEREAVLWTSGGNQISTHRIWVKDGLTRGQSTELPGWTVADIQVTVNAGQATLGTGRIACHVAYPGYAGRSHYVMTGVANPHEVAALAYKWVNRCRRAASGQG